MDTQVATLGERSGGDRSPSRAGALVWRVLAVIAGVVALVFGVRFILNFLRDSSANRLLVVVVAIAVGVGGVFAVFALVTGIVLAAATEYQIVPMRRAQGGTEAATSFLAITYLMGAAAWLARRGASAATM